MASVKLVPCIGASGVVNAQGRNFQINAGVQDLSLNDLAAQTLGANGWAMLPPHGPTSARPKLARPGAAFCDDTLQLVCFALVFPPGSERVTGWTDMNGNSV